MPDIVMKIKKTKYLSMRNICTIIIIGILAFSTLSINAKKKQRMPMPEATEEWDILARKEFKKQRDAFMANDSSLRTLHDLGWANDIKTDALFPNDKKHAFLLPYGVIFQKARYGMSIEYSPCGETSDTDEYWSEHAVAIHTNLDSALVKVKRKAVARLFMRAAHSIWSTTGENGIDSTQYNNIYSLYMQQAEFDCIAVNRDHKNNYIVYATLHVPRLQKELEITDEQMLQILFQMSDYIEKENILKKYINQMEKAETPIE